MVASLFMSLHAFMLFIFTPLFPNPGIGQQIVIFRQHVPPLFAKADEQEVMPPAAIQVLGSVHPRYGIPAECHIVIKGILHADGVIFVRVSEQLEATICRLVALRLHECTTQAQEIVLSDFGLGIVQHAVQEVFGIALLMTEFQIRTRPKD